MGWKRPSFPNYLTTTWEQSGSQSALLVEKRTRYHAAGDRGGVSRFIITRSLVALTLIVPKVFGTRYLAFFFSFYMDTVFPLREFSAALVFL